jgi:hypothetical protein
MRSKIAIVLAALGLMLVPGSALASPAASGFCPAFNLDQAAATDPSCDALPHFKASFINRVWAFGGSVDDVDLSAHTLDMTTSGIENLPAQFHSQEHPILDQDTHVLFAANTKVFDTDGNAVTQDYLEYADDVVVRGKLLPPSKWAVNEDGLKVPTIRAKRIYIHSYVDKSSLVPAPDASPTDPAATPSPDTPPVDPTPAGGTVTTIDVTVLIHLHIEVRR